MRLLTNPSNFRSKTLAIGLLAAAALLLPAFSASADASSLTIYSNPLKSLDQRSEIQQKGRGNCVRVATKAAIRFRLGKRTSECRYLVPVAGRDLDVAATGRIFKATPGPVRPFVYLGLGLRQATGPSRYEFAVFPSGRRYQLRRVLPGGKVQVLDRGRAAKIGGFGEASRMVFRAYSGVIKGKPRYSTRLVGIVNGKVIAVADVARGNLVAGQDTSMSISSGRNATGAYGSFTDIRVRMPNPF